MLWVFIALKINRPRPGLKPRTLGPMASTITTRPPRATTNYATQRPMRWTAKIKLTKKCGDFSPARQNGCEPQTAAYSLRAGDNGLFRLGRAVTIVVSAQCLKMWGFALPLTTRFHETMLTSIIYRNMIRIIRAEFLTKSGANNALRNHK
jgi:hypothetical protein